MKYVRLNLYVQRTGYSEKAILPSARAAIPAEGSVQ